MPLRSIHLPLVLQMWVLKGEKSALAGPLFLICVLKRQSGPHCRHYMSGQTAAVKWGVTPCNSASSSEKKTSPAVISNRENWIVTVLSSRNRLTCTADYFVQLQGEVRVFLSLTDNCISLSSRSEQEGQNIYSSGWLKIIIAGEIWKRPVCFVVSPGVSVSPQLLLTGESFCEILSDIVYVLLREELFLLFCFERSAQSIILLREFNKLYDIKRDIVIIWTLCV